VPKFKKISDLEPERGMSLLFYYLHLMALIYSINILYYVGLISSLANYVAQSNPTWKTRKWDVYIRIPNEDSDVLMIAPHFSNCTVYLL